jgi:hypothetical protein
MDQLPIDSVSPLCRHLSRPEIGEMHMRIAIAALFAASLAALPLSAARAQYDPYCNSFPLTWPFCIAGAAVGAAATIATAPFYAVGSGPYYYYGRPYYYRTGYYYPVRHHKRYYYRHY